MNSFQEPEMAAALAAGGGKGDLRNTRLFHVLATVRTDTVKLEAHRWNFLLGVGTKKASEYWTSTLLPLNLLLAECADFEATDPRDKVYALLGLSSDDSARVIQPNYEHKITRDVYMDAAHYVLGTKSPLALLPFAGISDRTPDSIANLPSWVPDWTSPPGASALDEPLHNYYNETRYYASLTSNPEIAIDLNTDILTLGGAIVDQIASLASVCHFESIEDRGPIETYGSYFYPQQVARFVEWHDEAFNLALDATKLRSSIDEAFWRTLIGDTTPSSRPAPAQLGDDYRKWITSSRLVHRYHQQKGRGVALPVGLSPASPEFAIWGSAMGLCAVKRRLCVTRSGDLGMVPPGSQVGDLVAIILGAKTPYVLRKSKHRAKDAFELVGECYMHGMMDGEMMVRLPRMERLAII